MSSSTVPGGQLSAPTRAAVSMAIALLSIILVSALGRVMPSMQQTLQWWARASSEPKVLLDTVVNLHLWSTFVLVAVLGWRIVKWQSALEQHPTEGELIAYGIPFFWLMYWVTVIFGIAVALCIDRWANAPEAPTTLGLVLYVLVGFFVSSLMVGLSYLFGSSNNPAVPYSSQLSAMTGGAALFTGIEALLSHTLSNTALLVGIAVLFKLLSRLVQPGRVVQAPGTKAADAPAEAQEAPAHNTDFS